MWVRQNTLWSYDKGRWLPVPVLTGVTDNRETQIVAGATAGQSFVTGVKRRGGVSIKKAIELRGAALKGDDAQMEFAAALITLSGPREEHAQHAQKAIAGAKTDTQLAQNLATHFMGPKDPTVSERLAKDLTTK